MFGGGFRRAIAHDLAAVMDAERAARAVLVGVSIGACAAMELALARPDRVEALVLVGATPFAATAKDTATNLLLAAITRAFGLRGGLTKMVLGTLFGPSFRAEAPDETRAWERRLEALAPRDVHHIFRAWTARPRLLAGLGSIRVPTLVVVGDEDTACPEPHAEAIRAAIPGARLERISRAGHTTPAERPRELAALVAKFLEGNATK